MCSSSKERCGQYYILQMSDSLDVKESWISLATSPIQVVWREGQSVRESQHTDTIPFIIQGVKIEGSNEYYVPSIELICADWIPRMDG